MNFLNGKNSAIKLGARWDDKGSVFCVLMFPYINIFLYKTKKKRRLNEAIVIT